MRYLLLAVLAACHTDGAIPDAVAGDDVAVMPDASPSALPALTLCHADASNVAAAYVIDKTTTTATYACAQACSDVATCSVDLLDQQGHPVQSSRGGALKLLVFVVDDMGGDFIYTSDGDDVVVTHGGVGGTGGLHDFDRELQAHSTLKTVSLNWDYGVGVFGSGGGGGGGWFTRKDTTGTSVHALAVRPAAAIQWVKQNFAVGKKLGTVGASFGTIATFGPHVWYGLESIIDYQMLIGGPPYWDVNMGCGRAHTSAGHCDVDVAPCTGNPNSSYGNDDPACGADATNQCRVPTIMAQLAGAESEFDNAINYVINSTACSPAATRDPDLDASSLAFTVDNWTFHGRIDFVAQEGAPQPPQSDQGMGEGHAMYVYTAIQSAKGWIDDDGHHHGDAWQKDPALVAATAPIVITGMGH